jgi:hypothetical protein
MNYLPGEVLRVTWDDRPIRVLMADHLEVFYDAFFPEIGWIMAPRRTSIYYRVARSFLQSTGKLLRSEPLTDDECAKHRPDLPMRMLQNGIADWKCRAGDWPAMETGFAVECPRLALIPFGPNGAPQPPTLVESKNGRSITGDELLAAAQQVQVSRCRDVEGVGLYRSGTSRGVPSYYLWGAIDRAGHAR